MAEKLSGNVGWGMGLEFRESSHLLRTRNTAPCRAGMVFNVVVGAPMLSKREGRTPSLSKSYRCLKFFSTFCVDSSSLLQAKPNSTSRQ